MPTIIERIDTAIAAHQAEKDRIKADADRDIAAVNARLVILRGAKAAMTPEIEQAYVALLSAGLVREIE